MKKKIFGIALLGVLSTLSAGVISQNGIAKDSATGLMWQDNNDSQTIKKDWNGAKAYCENLTLGGFSDWRLPNIYELNTLLDNTKSSKPFVIDGIENISNNDWSSTTDASGSSGAWGVSFNSGYDVLVNKAASAYVRCVRVGQLNFDNLVTLKNSGKLKVSQEVINEINVKNEQVLKKQEQERIASISRQRESEIRQKAYENETVKFRKTLKEGDDTTIGLVVQIKGELIKVQTNDEQCSQRDYSGSCRNWIKTPVEKWVKRSEIYPR